MYIRYILEKSKPYGKEHSTHLLISLQALIFHGISSEHIEEFAKLAYQSASHMLHNNFSNFLRSLALDWYRQLR